MSGSWFPRPADASSIQIRRNRGVSAEEILALLSSPEAIELREKVGVVGPVDGSAKTSVRLLASGGWIFKLDLSASSPEPDGPRRHLERRITDFESLHNVWHEEKFWFTLFDGEGYHAVSACPELTTLRQLGWERFSAAWRRALGLALDVSDRFNVGLDLNPANFGLTEDGRMYYLDDEIYDKLSHEDVAEAIVMRLPENGGRSEAEWRAWGQAWSPILSCFRRSKYEWGRFLSAIRAYPITEAFTSSRRALTAGLKEVFEPLKKAKTAGFDFKAKRICVFADVHSNYPALRAVLEEVRQFEVDGYLFLGDLVGYGPHPRECIEALMQLEPAILLQGNHDRSAGLGESGMGSNKDARRADAWTHAQLDARHRSWLTALPVEHVGVTWLAVHGAPQDPERMHGYVYEMTFRSNLDYLSERHFRLGFYGHTHVPFIYLRGDDPEQSNRKVGARDWSFAADDVALVNPGSVGQPRDGDSRAAFAIWDRWENRLSFHRVDYPVEVTMKDILAAGLPEDSALRLEVGR